LKTQNLLIKNQNNKIMNYILRLVGMIMIQVALDPIFGWKAIFISLGLFWITNSKEIK